MFTLKEVFTYQKDNEISDIHIVTGETPLARNHKGELTSFSDDVITAENMQDFLNEVCNEEEKEILKKFGNLDKAKEFKNIARFRVNIFTEQRGLGMNFRIIQKEIINTVTLEVPKEIQSYALGRSGLILISGPNNSGKTTIVNALVDLINEHKKVKIITFEDPVEFIHKRKQSLISQHEITEENKERMSGDLRSVFRQDANIIVIGEIRDAAMMNIALEMCETGYLVIATIHGTDTVQTLQRIANMFPADNRNHLFKQLSNQLRSILCQYLIPNKSGKLARCREILITTDGIKNLIANGEMDEIYRQLETDSMHGNMLFDQSLIDLYRKGEITQDSVFEYCHNRNYVKQAF